MSEVGSPHFKEGNLLNLYQQEECLTVDTKLRNLNKIDIFRMKPKQDSKTEYRTKKLLSRVQILKNTTFGLVWC